MKKKSVVMLMLSTSLLAGVVTGCGSKTDDVNNAQPPVESDSETNIDSEVAVDNSEADTEFDINDIPEADTEYVEVEDTENTDGVVYPELDGTIGELVTNDFKQAVSEGGSTSDIANSICMDGNLSVYSLGTAEVQAGYLAGFSEDVTGFKEATVFQPMIGTIPFIGYVFEVESDAEAFAETLKSIANPRWNVCTEAEETSVEVSGNYVFFAMTPSSFE